MTKSLSQNNDVLTTKIRSGIRSALRKLWQWSPEPRAALKASFKPGKGYKCVECGASHFKRHEVSIDHITPIGATPGSKMSTDEDTWDTFINRMFVSIDELQILCEDCHAGKTKEDKQLLKERRQAYDKRNKPASKKK